MGLADGGFLVIDVVEWAEIGFGDKTVLPTSEEIGESFGPPPQLPF